MELGMDKELQDAKADLAWLKNKRRERVGRCDICGKKDELIYGVVIDDFPVNICPDCYERNKDAVSSVAELTCTICGKLIGNGVEYTATIEDEQGIRKDTVCEDCYVELMSEIEKED